MNKIDPEDKKYLDAGMLEKEEESFILYENTNVDKLIFEKEGYTLFKEDRGRKGFLYTIYDPDDAIVYAWVSFFDVEKAKDPKKTPIYRTFLDEIEQDQKYGRPLLFDDEGELIDAEHYDAFSDEDDYDDYGYYGSDYLFPRSPRTRSSLTNYTGYTYTPRVKEKGIAEKLCNSDTLVFHKDDPSTRMLCQVYEGKGWDVLTKSCYDIDDEEVKELFEKHDRLVFLGHGTPYGLMGMFGSEVASYMKGKKIFAIWCNADAYFKQHHIGEGQFVTGNMPSEVWECRSAGCGKISTELMLENITYWSKLCADVTEDCLEGKVKESVDYIRKNYLEKYGNHPVTIYNCNRTQCLGQNQPLPSFEFKGEPLTEKDFPVPDFDEVAFLQNPTEDAYKCPRLKVEVEVEEPEGTTTSDDTDKPTDA